jgi:hypothetical protein
MIETVIGECAAWRAAALTENPTVAQARIMSRHGETIGAMVNMWTESGRRPYQYRYDSTADVILWNIPEAATGWFVFDPRASDAAASRGEGRGRLARQGPAGRDREQG